MWTIFALIMYILLCISEHIGAVIIIVLLVAVIGLIAENIEIASIVIAVLSLIISSLCYKHVTEYCFDNSIMGLIFVIASHIFFFFTLGLSGWLVFILIVFDFLALFAFSECEDCEVISILIALASIIIPAIFILKN